MYITQPILANLRTNKIAIISLTVASSMAEHSQVVGIEYSYDGLAVLHKQCGSLLPCLITELN